MPPTDRHAFVQSEPDCSSPSYIHTDRQTGCSLKKERVNQREMLAWLAFVPRLCRVLCPRVQNKGGKFSAPRCTELSASPPSLESLGGSRR